MSGITLKRPLDDKGLDHLEQVLNEYVKHLDRTIDWGEHEGRKRKPCPEQPLTLIGMPLGQYHCPVCMEMQIAGLPHMTPDENYERMTGQPWPAGYEASNQDSSPE